jgi:hypothetical protein
MTGYTKAKFVTDSEKNPYSDMKMFFDRMICAGRNAFAAPKHTLKHDTSVSGIDTSMVGNNWEELANIPYP